MSFDTKMPCVSPFDRGFRAGMLAVLGFGLLFAVDRLQAQSLENLVEKALYSEPGLLSARSDLAAAEARYDQRLGALLPQVEASLNTRYNGRNYITRPQPEDPSSVDTSDEDQQKAPQSGRASAVEERGRYNSSGGELVLRMPIFQPVKILDKRQSALEWEQARARYDAARQQLMFKLVDAWLEFHASRQELLVTEQQVSVNERQLKMVSRGAELGAFSVPQQDEAASRLASSKADALSAQNALGLKRLALEHLVGAPVKLEDLPVPLVTSNGGRAKLLLEGATLQSLLIAAEDRNSNMRAADLARQATQQSVKRARAAHLPTLDLRAALERNAQGLGTSAGQSGFQSTQASIGVDLRIPIFSGGTDAARVRETAAQLESAEHEREAARRKVQAEVHQAWYQLEVAGAKAEAALLSMKAASSLGAQAKLGVQQGVKSELDVLQAQVQAQTALRDWVRARYDRVRSVVQLRALTNDLSVARLVQIEAELTAELPVRSEMSAPAHVAGKDAMAAAQ